MGSSLSSSSFAYSLALYLILSISSIVCPLCFGLLRLNGGKRSTIGLGGLGCFIYAQAGPGAVALPNYPCWLKSLLGVFVVPLLGTNLVCKLPTTRFNSGPRWTLLCLALLVPFVIVFAVEVGAISGCSECPAATTAQLVVLCVINSALVLYVGIHHLHRQPVGETKEVIWLTGFYLLAWMGVLLQKYETSRKPEPYNYELVIVLALWLFVAWQVASPLLIAKTVSIGEATTVEWQFAPSSPHTSVEMRRVLSDPGQAKRFESFLEQELSIESLWFIQETDQWKQAFPTSTPQQRGDVAKRLLETYLEPNAPREINISNGCSNATRLALAVPHAVPVTVFDLARQEVEDLLQYGAFARYQELGLI
ncbi:hypothetical protein BASA81_003211 [Batrachochytrium salamandrivorans]|nr:hypothetical protein BASA81_003211 [Batrachochytrium salamandrivorans]